MGGDQVRTTAGDFVPMKEIKNVTLTIGGRPAGRMLMDSKDQEGRESTGLDLVSFTEWYDTDAITGRPVGPAHPVPWKGRKVYVLWVHGNPGSSVVPSVRGSVALDGSQSSRYLRRRRSFRELGPDVVLVLATCWGDARPGREVVGHSDDAPFVADPWGVRSQAQVIANELNRRAYAPTRVHITTGSHTGVLTNAVGDLGGFVEVRPEPGPDKLDELSRIAGLYDLLPDVNERRDTTLRLVTGLRQTFGVSVEDDRDDPSGAYQELLSGLGALEVMRRADLTKYAGRGAFTPELLTRIVRAHTGALSVGHARPALPGHADVRTTLLAARIALDAGATADLSSFVTMSSVDRALELLAEGDEETQARQVLQLPSGYPVSGIHRQQLLWATVMAVEAVDNHPDAETLIRQVTHVPRYETVDLAADFDSLLSVATEAAAIGRDVYNPTALAAYELQRHGALDSPTGMMSQTGHVVGRNWTTSTFTNRIETDYYTVTDPATGTTTRHRMPGGEKASPYVLAVEPGTEPGTVAMPWPDQTYRSIPYEVLAELLRNDPHLRRTFPTRARITIVGLDRDSARTLGDVVSKRKATGRMALTLSPSAALRYDLRRNVFRLALNTADPDRSKDWNVHRPENLSASARGVGTAPVVTNSDTSLVGPSAAVPQVGSPGVADVLAAPVPAPVAGSVRPAGPVRVDSSGSSVSEDSERMSPEDAMWSNFERDKRELWHRINSIHRLAADNDFREGVRLFLEN
ncbi:lonely Cys domain-containing protein, partial [Streptomyces parvulus]|uniref:lonely Cys domain-containing protein n=1 Tax=Streptomyces parvulus TaxID=146923 RepID=UPI00342D8C31